MRPVSLGFKVTECDGTEMLFEVVLNPKFNEQRPTVDGCGVFNVNPFSVELSQEKEYIYTPRFSRLKKFYGRLCSYFSLSAKPL